MKKKKLENIMECVLVSSEVVFYILVAITFFVALVPGISLLHPNFITIFWIGLALSSPHIIYKILSIFK